MDPHRARSSTAPERVRTLVLGGSGFLGTHVLREVLALAARDGHGAVMSASRGPDFSAVPRGVEIHVLDALARGRAEALCDDLAPTHVILCSALSKMPECEAYPVLARALNAEFPARIARWCEAHRARLVFVSTDLVFGGATPGATGFTETDAPAPVSVYGRTKLDGEHAVQDACPGALVARISLLFGDSCGRGLGASDGLLAAIARGQTPCLFTDEWRTPLSAEDAGQALAALAHEDVAGILHIAGGDRCTRHELGLAVLRSRGWSHERANRTIRAGTRGSVGLEMIRPADVSLDSRRAWSLVGSAMPHPLRDLVQHAEVPEQKGST